MNASLVRIHRFLYLACLASFLVLVFVIWSFAEGDKAATIAISFAFAAPLFAMHYFGSIGARGGKAWGRTLSRILGIMLLFGIPIGTAIGVYLLSQTGEKWESG